ncbi:hypothetical protein HRS9122_06586 [Pyrenophora teres f. teres]|nr:hypothetical protein HRS9122_06586 [Pyrenophora teres f. teres]
MKHTDWFRAQVDPWAIPKDDCKWVMASNDIRDQFPGSERYLGGHSERLDLTLSYRYSAAAVAIEFLGSCSSNQHRNIRHMVLDEDLVAIAHPASHAQGLIPYCQKNPKMRIERRVDMWRNLLPGGATPFQTYAAQSYRKDELEAKYVTNAVGDWIIEANALSSLGMPTDVFSLVLDGGETAERTSEVFKTVHRDCAWQKAFEISVTRSHFNIPPDISRWGHRSCGYRGLPKAITDMVQGNSIVKCNFDTGGIWDEQEIEELVQEGRKWSFRVLSYTFSEQDVDGIKRFLGGTTDCAHSTIHLPLISWPPLFPRLKPPHKKLQQGNH